MKLIPDTIVSKEQFLIEHNRLSPTNLQATFALLTCFQEEEKPLLKDTDWSNKLRIPFITWLLTMSAEKKKSAQKITPQRGSEQAKQEYKIYPNSEFEH